MNDSRWVVLSVLLWSVTAQAGDKEVVDRIAAVIEGDIVTLRELEARAKPYLQQLDTIEDQAKRATQRTRTLRDVLDIEISEKLVDAEIASSSDLLGVTDQDVDRAIAEVTRMNNLTREQLQAALYGQGMTWSEYRKKLRSQIERARLIQMKVQGKVQVSPDDVKDLCRERQKAGTSALKVCASHVLIAISPSMSASDIENARVRASKLQAELAAGADFSAYAMKYSDDKGSPDGSLGCFGRGEMVEAFDEVAFATAPGDVSVVVRTNFGFHIIKVDQRRAPAADSCEGPEELRPFQNEVYQREMERQMEVWVGELRKKAFVEVRL